MICFISPKSSPYFNLAAEEYFLRNFQEELFILYVNDPCVVVGKHQNALAECNYSYLRKNNIPIARRLSGGGTVFHDRGNINFSIVKNFTDSSKSVDFKSFLDPIMRFLHSKGIPAEYSKRNDLLVEGKKFSGNAEHVYQQGKRTLHHGTILFDSKLDKLSNSLKTQENRYSHKAVRSVRSQVSNISQYLDPKLTIESFQKDLLDFITIENSTNEYVLTDLDFNAIDSLVKEKFDTWKWNLGYSPKYDLSTDFNFKGKEFTIVAQIKKGVILNIQIRMDGDLMVVSGILNGEDLEWENIKTILLSSGIDMELCEEFLENLF